MVPESVSSLLGAEASEGLAQRGDDDSLSAESLDSVSHGKEPKILVIKAHHHVPINKKIRVCRQCSYPKLFILLEINSQCNQSPSPRHHTDTSNAASWSRHLIQQTLMDEGLRLARMVSHDRACKIIQGSEGAHSSGDFLRNYLKISGY